MTLTDELGSREVLVEAILAGVVLGLAGETLGGAGPCVTRSDEYM